jgi:hypothetical protein
MKKIIIYITIPIIILATACEKEIKFKGDDVVNPRLVINSLYRSGEVITVNISKSSAVFDDTKPSYINNAIVDLYEDNTKIETLKIRDNGDYTSTSAIAENKQYTVKVSATGLSAEATQNTPVNVPFVVSKTEKGVYLKKDISSDASQTATYVTIKFNDAQHNNYYIVKAHTVYDNDSYTEASIFYEEYDKSQNDINFSETGKELYTNLIFSDFGFNGTTKQYRFGIDLDPQYFDSGYSKGIRVDLFSISYDYYQYLLTLNSYQNNKDNFFSEKSNVHTNITNGLGIFAASTVKSVLIPASELKNLK